MATKKAKDLLSQIEEIRIECHIECVEDISVRRKGYKNIAQIYMWIEGALKHPDVLDHIKTQYSIKITDDSKRINFTQLFKLMYADKLDPSSKSRKKKMLEAIDKEYKDKPSLYKKNTINKLINFIETSGGQDGLTKSQRNQELQNTTNSTDSQNDTSGNNAANNELINFYEDDIKNEEKKYKPLITQQPLIMFARQYVASQASITKKNTALLPEAELYFKTRQTRKTNTINAPIKINDEFISLTIRKNDFESYEIIEQTAITNKESINQIKINFYKNQYSELPNSLRCIYETIRTQLLTKNTIIHENKLEHFSRIPSYFSKNTTNSINLNLKVKIQF
jgi:hypothetical protein